MSPSPSRSHWIAAPAMKTLPSSAYTGSPRGPQASVVISPRAAAARRLPVLSNRNAPVPYVFFACPGATQPCPNRAACWPPARPARSHAPLEPGDVLEQPLHLGGGKIGIEDEAGARANQRALALLRELPAARRGAPVLPHDRAIERPPRATLPHAHRLALVGDPAALGITNQRETVCVWERGTGRPLYRAIVWQDRRTATRCRQLAKQRKGALIRARTGLVLDPYFSATKMEWLLEHVPGLERRVRSGGAGGRPAGGPVRAGLRRAGAGEEHVRHGSVPVAQHRQAAGRRGARADHYARLRSARRAGVRAGGQRLHRRRRDPVAARRARAHRARRGYRAARVRRARYRGRLLRPGVRRPGRAALGAERPGHYRGDH